MHILFHAKRKKATLRSKWQAKTWVAIRFNISSELLERHRRSGYRTECMAYCVFSHSATCSFTAVQERKSLFPPPLQSVRPGGQTPKHVHNPQQAQCAYGGLLGWRCTQWQADFGFEAPSQHGLLPGTSVVVAHTVCMLKEPHSCSYSGGQASDCSTVCLLTIWNNCRRSAMGQMWMRVSCFLPDRQSILGPMGGLTVLQKRKILVTTVPGKVEAQRITSGKYMNSGFPSLRPPREPLSQTGSIWIHSRKLFSPLNTVTVWEQTENEHSNHSTMHYQVLLPARPLLTILIPEKATRKWGQ